MAQVADLGAAEQSQKFDIATVQERDQIGARVVAHPDFAQVLGLHAPWSEQRRAGVLQAVENQVDFTLPLGSLTREDLLEAVSGVNRGTNIETLIGYTFDSLRREIAQRRRSAFSVDELVAEIEVQAPVLKMEAANTLRPATRTTLPSS